MVLEVQLRVLAALPNAFFAIRVPRARLLDDPRLGRNVDEQRFMADAFVEHDVEFRLPERRRDLVLHDLHAHVIADDHLALFHRPDAPHVQTHGGVELQRPAAARGLGIAEHDTDLLTQLIDENHGGA